VLYLFNPVEIYTGDLHDIRAIQTSGGGKPRATRAMALGVGLYFLYWS